MLDFTGKARVLVGEIIEIASDTFTRLANEDFTSMEVGRTE